MRKTRADKPAAKYYMLRCDTCELDFEPVGSDNPAELLYPDFDQAAEEAGYQNAVQLDRFHQRHKEHHLVVKEDTVQ